MLPALGMADNNHFAAGFLELISRDFAGKSAIVLPKAVLGAELDFAAGQNFADGFQTSKRRANGHLGPAAGFGLDFFGQSRALRSRKLHFPVGDNQGFFVIWHIFWFILA